MGRGATEALAQGVSESLPEQRGLQAMSDTLRMSVADGSSMNFVIELTAKTAGRGNHLAANQLTSVVDTGLEAIRARHSEAQTRVDELNGQLGRLAAENRAVLTDEQLRVATEDFRVRHAADYDALERETQNVTGALDSIAQLSDPAGPGRLLRPENRAKLQMEADRTLINVVPRLGETAAGSEAISSALEKRSAGNEGTFLSQMGRVINNLNDHQFAALAGPEITGAGIKSALDFKKAVAATTFEGATYGIAKNDPVRAEKILNGLEKSSAVIGVAPEKLAEITHEVRTISTTSDPEKLRAAEENLKTKTRDLTLLGTDTRAGQAFGGFMTAYGALLTGQSLAQMDQRRPAQRVMAVGSALQLTGDGMDIVVKSFQKLDALRGASGWIATRTPLLGVLVSGIGMVDSIQREKHLSTAGHAASMAGGSLMGCGLAHQRRRVQRDSGRRTDRGRGAARRRDRPAAVAEGARLQHPGGADAAVPPGRRASARALLEAGQPDQ